MINPTQTITIDRTGLALSPLVFSATKDANVLGIVSYQPPAYLAANGYMPDHPDVDGSELTSTRWAQSLLNFDWMRDGASSETVVQAARNEVLQAIGQVRFTVTTQISGAPAEVWRANRGSMTPSPRTYVDLAHLVPVYAVAIPVQPIPGA